MDQFERLQDKILICVDCKEEFAFTIGAQEYFAERGFTEEPKRCRTCYADYKKKSAHRRISRSSSDSGFDDGGPGGGNDDEGGPLVWQPKPFPPPPRQDHDRCGFGDDERWAK